MHRLSTFLAAAVLAAGGLPVLAQTTVRDAWARSTVPQQKTGGVYAEIVSAAGGRLVQASSPLAGSVEIHEMTMHGDVMRMRALPSLELPAGRAVRLAPGGRHLMLLGLRQPLTAGDAVPLTLVVEGAGGRRETLQVQARVRAAGAAAPAGGPRAAAPHTH